MVTDAKALGKHARHADAKGMSQFKKHGSSPREIRRMMAVLNVDAALLHHGKHSKVEKFRKTIRHIREISEDIAKLDEELLNTIANLELHAMLVSGGGLATASVVEELEDDGLL
jgi:diaminopimelate decarboxylase